jgi:glutaminase
MQTENTIAKIIREVHDRYKECGEGALADYIPELTRANPDWYGISVFTTDGFQYQVGDWKQEFTIQSVSKAFTYGMILDDHGIDFVETKIGVEPSGEAFNSISLDPGTGRPRNPMINAGAIAAVGQVDGKDMDTRFRRILHKFSEYAGRQLSFDQDVYQSESDTGFRNRAIANLLRSFNIIDDPVTETVEVYFKQCSILVNCADLALMGGTLANGGVNPVTRKRVIKLENVDKVLSVMSTCGMYDYSGTWIYEVGLPAKSGVGGGVVGVLPGQLGLAVFSPKLDIKGNSVRGVRTFRDLSKRFNLHLFNFPSISDNAIRRVYHLGEVASSRRRGSEQRRVLREHGNCTTVFELQGDLFVSAVERLIRAEKRVWDTTQYYVFDLKRAGLIDQATQGILQDIAEEIASAGKVLIMVDPNKLLDRETFLGDHLETPFSDELDDALEYCENRIVANYLPESIPTAPLKLGEMETFADFSEEELAILESLVEWTEFPRGTRIVQQGAPSDAMYFLALGAVSICLQRENSVRTERLAGFFPTVVIGEMGVIDKQTRSADVWADEDSICYKLTAESLERLRDEHPRVYCHLLEQLLRDMSERLRNSNREVSLLKL